MISRKRQDQRGRGTRAFPRYSVQVQPPQQEVEKIAMAWNVDAAIMYARRHHELYGWPAIVRDSLTGAQVFKIARTGRTASV